MKKPEEIKKGLNICSNSSSCRGCPYQVFVEGSFGCEEQCCDDGLLPDALAYIQQLEAERDELKDEVDRDCETCKHNESCQVDGYCVYCENRESDKTPCCNCVYSCNWEWRGAQKEE